MLRNLRKIGYTLLSRNFYIGITVGFTIATFLYTPLAHASTISPTGTVKLYGGYAVNTDPTGSTLATSVIGQTYTYQTYFSIYTNNPTAGNASNFRVHAFLYPANLDVSVTSLEFTYVKTGSCSTAVTSPGNPGNDFDNGSSIFNTASTTGYKKITVTSADRSRGGIGFKLHSMNGSGSCQLDIYSVLDNLGNEYVVPDTGGSSPSSGGGDITFTPLNTNATISNVNCITSSTGSDCVLTYATSSVAVNPQNLLYITLAFGLAFLASFWIIRQLT